LTTRIAVFLSGAGNKLQALLDAIKAGRLSAEVILVVSNRKAAYGLIRAERANIETLYFPLKPYRSHPRGREQYDADLAEQVRVFRPDLLVFAGWMHILSQSFLKHFPNRMINIHPAPPGSFPGAHCIEEAFEAYQRGEISQSGCMVHYVTARLDAGPVIAQLPVPIEPGDTLPDFEARMQRAEQRLIVAAVAQLVNVLKA